MISLGYQPMVGRDGLKHKIGSLHYQGLAVDIDLCLSIPYIDGTYTTKSEDHKIFGEYWKSLDKDCRWGGDFKNTDGNHYSLTYLGLS
jgi:hypothetical protein